VSVHKETREKDGAKITRYHPFTRHELSCTPLGESSPEKIQILSQWVMIFVLCVLLMQLRAGPLQSLIEAKRRCFGLIALENLPAASPEKGCRIGNEGALSLKARIRRLEALHGPELTVIFVNGGGLFQLEIKACFGGREIKPNSGEAYEDFLERAKRLAIEAGESILAISGLPRPYGLCGGEKP
jgi:hypothetical protein